MSDDFRTDFLGAFAVLTRREQVLLVGNDREIGGRTVRTWDLPGGRVEAGELLHEALARELREETGLALDPSELRLYSLGSITQINEVYVAFRASVGEACCAPGPEALDVRFFSEAELPWDQVAFPRANYSIQMAYDDIRRGRFGLYLAQHDRGELVDQFEHLVVSDRC